MTNSQLDYQKKYITKQEVTHYGDERIFSITTYYDLTKETKDDELRDIIEYDIEVLRELLFEKLKNIPRGEQANEKMEQIYKFIENW